MTIKSISKGAVPVVVGVLAAGLVIRYLGQLPVISDAAKGLNGNTAGKLFG